ncbi:hypothetical protein AJ78_02955 [Emergomyces pasteurianus Ep9510]|uniref:Restriction of telomere capping protein 4 n=1 Tax=Emergomyces pasteurianus Ep9510 TaxID=1447872 RepID=A0A1J9PLD8_9EURO|nr:hypothetical protein AJ78_02955 [Emergomyces pasteurianus Ep9510]
MCSDWNVYTLFNPSLRAVKTPQPSNPANLPLSRPLPASHQPQPQPHFSILSTCNSLQTVSASFISPQTLSHSLLSRSLTSSCLLHVPSYPLFKDHHEVLSRAEDTHLNDFDEFLAGLDAADLNSSLCVLILSDADVERSSQCLNDETHGSHGFPDEDEDRGQEKDDEFLSDSSSAVERSLVRSVSTKTLSDDSSSTPVLDSISQTDLLKLGSDQDTFTTDEFIVNSIFTSSVKQDTTNDATFISHSFKTDAESVKASTVIAGEHSIPLKKQRQPEVGIGAMHFMIVVKVMTQAVDFEPVNKRLVHDRGCVEDNMIMSDMSDFCALFNDTDDNYRASSEENGLIKSSLKCYRVSVNVSLSLSKPRTPLEILHLYTDEQPHSADGLSMSNTKPCTLSLFFTVIVMYSMCNSVIKIETFSVFNAVNNCIFCSCYKSVVHKKVQKHDRKILSQSVLHSTGYYGLRDCKILSAHVVSHFKDVINSLAGIDSVVSKYGLVVYAQKVLVLELLKMLIQKNMKVNVKETCQILKKSNEIENLLNLE